MEWASRALNAFVAIATVAFAVAIGSTQKAHADDLADALAQRPSHVATNWNGVAAAGYDVVAFFTKGEATKGSRDIVATYDGAIYRFSEEAHRVLFLKDPQALSPQLGGYDAYGVRKGKKVRPQRTIAWQIDDEQLYLFVDSETKDLWNARMEANARVAKAIWAEIRDVPKSMLVTPAGF